MKRFLLLTALVLAGCATVQPVTCGVESDFNSAVVPQIETIGGCTNTAAITASLQSWEAPLNLCPTSGAAQGALSDVCVALIPIIEQAGNQIPILQSWGCDLTKASSVTSLFNEACNLIPNAKKMHFIPVRKTKKGGKS